MALAGIDTLLIQASYSQQPAESRCLGTGRGTEGACAGGSGLSGVMRCRQTASSTPAGGVDALCLIFPSVKWRL